MKSVSQTSASETSFGSWLQVLRREASLSQRDTAARAQIKVSYLRKIESDYCAPPSDFTIAALSKAVHCDADELFARAGKVDPKVIGLLSAFPLLVQAVRVLSQWDEGKLRGWLKLNQVPESRLHYSSPNKGILNYDEDRRHRREPISRELKLAVFRLDNNECVYCSSTKLLEVDHIQPVCLGGTNDLDNLVTCCAQCNLKKQNRSTPPPRVFGRFAAEIFAAESFGNNIPDLSELIPDITPEMMQEIKDNQQKQIKEWEEQSAELAKTLEKLNAPQGEEEEEGEGQ